MRGRLASLVAVATGALLVRVVLTHAYTSYVKPGAGPALLLAAAVLLVAGGVGLVQREAADHPPPPVAFLLAVPVVLLVVVAPPSLGAYYAQHAGNAPSRPGDSGPLRLGADGVADLSLWQVVGRAERGHSLEGAALRVKGFVAGTDSSGRVLLTRFSVRCCAADATVSQVAVVTDTRPKQDSWLTVTGSVVGRDGRVPVLKAASVAPSEEPEDPYES